MKFFSKVKKNIKLGYRTPNPFRRNVKHKIAKGRHVIMQSIIQGSGATAV